MASKELQLVIELCQLSRRRRRPGAVELGRLAELHALYDECAEGHRLPSNVKYQPVDAGGISAEWVKAPKAADDRVLMYLHGGCYGTGSAETHRDLTTRLSLGCSIPVLALNYRLAPLHPFPAAVEDAAAAYRWLLKTGFEPARIAIAGDSAGAGLALATMLMIRDEGLPLPSAAVCLSPWVDLAVTGDSMESKALQDPIVSREMLLGWAKLYLGDHDPRTPLASPLYGDLRRIPSLLIQVGSAEVLIDDSRRLTEQALLAGVNATLEIWPDMIHGWQNFAAILPEARQAIARICQFVVDAIG